jgi:DNA-binding NtrC family response regulator
VGETEPRRFHGKLIAATNRDLAVEIAAGTFRQDLYYRLCSDVVQTPSLREQLDDCPGDLPLLVRLVAAKCLGDKATTDHLDWLAQLTVEWIERSPELGSGYAWPGNFRELEQCVRNVMVRGEYHPLPLPTNSVATISSAPKSPVDSFVDAVRRSSLSFDELLEQYCSLVFARSGNLTEAARRLDKHRATVQSRVREDLVKRFAGET